MRHVSAVFLLAASAGAQCHDLSPLTAIAGEAMTALRLRGCALRVEQHGALLYEQGFGTTTQDSVMPIASATKNLSAAVVMSLVDARLLSLDDRVSTWIPSFTGLKAGITVRQCFTHSSGLPGNHDAISNDQITLAQAADLIAQAPLIALPGTAFSYGGVSMHVVGRVCELASGRPWAQLFQERIAGPLGLVATDYLAFGATLNPRIAGGVRSTLREYARFAAMLAAGGVWSGQRVLSVAAIAEMFRDQVDGLPVLNSPHPHGGHYGIGTWIDRRDAAGSSLQVSGAGAFGFSMWLDLERNVAGTFAVLDRFPEVSPYLDRFQAVTWDALLPSGLSCTGTPTPACAGPIWMNATTVPRAGSQQFELFSFGAPASTAGVLLLAPDTDPIGTAALGIRLFLPLALPPVVVVTGTDPAGRGHVPAPLVGVARGQVFGAQFVWLNTPGCGGLGTLSSSHAVAVTVQ